MITECKRLLLERYVGGELDEAGRLEVRRHLDTCPDCSSLVARLESERTEFLQRHPFSSFTRAHAPVVTLPWYRSFLTVATRPALVPVYGVMLLLLVVMPLYFAGKRDDETIRFKGAPVLSFIYQRGGVVGEGSSDMRFRGGDRIQVTYSLSQPRNVALMSIDTRGTVSFYHPQRQAATCSVVSDAGSQCAFPGSIVLDDTPGEELVIALFSDAALKRDEVASWAKRHYAECPDPARLRRRLRADTAALNAEIATLLLQKE
ncbi:MAG: zf-HC2 domain-containing protein [Chitinispirillaceae bacterium]|nr:zf-HC2 domain-containing protein [Chitinispirillaceae bacterium]